MNHASLVKAIGKFIGFLCSYMIDQPSHLLESHELFYTDYFVRAFYNNSRLYQPNDGWLNS